MANRVLLNSKALKVSQPGVDVLTAPPALLMFNSDHRCIRLIQRGVVTVPFVSDIKIPYAKSFNSAPMVGVNPRGIIAPIMYFTNRYITETVNPVSGNFGEFHWFFEPSDAGPINLQGSLRITPLPQHIHIQSGLGFYRWGQDYDTNHSFQVAYNVWDVEA